ncbi:MAG TPA: peptide chain release factor 2, partial [Chitinophagaceae bacterium]|nr:peptide chain release factor 2 [Chitinophagaceae bacterium]
MTIEQLKVMRERVSSLKQFLAIEDKKMKIENDRQLSLSAGFWDDNQRATAILKEIKTQEFWVGLFEKVQTAVEDFAVMFDFWKMGEASEEDAREQFDHALKMIDELEFKSTLNDPEDELPAVLTINSGAGGTESQDWAEMLMRMYRMYGEKNGFKVREMDVQWRDGAGIKQATLE